MSAARIYWPPVLSADVSEEGSLIEKALERLDWEEEFRNPWYR
jgi:hypothetical protein